MTANKQFGRMIDSGSSNGSNGIGLPRKATGKPNPDPVDLRSLTKGAVVYVGDKRSQRKFKELKDGRVHMQGDRVDYHPNDVHRYAKPPKE